MMTKIAVLLTLVGLTIRSLIWLAVDGPSTLSVDTSFKTEESCVDPRGKRVQECSDLEEQILAATVRIELVSWSVLSDEAGYDIDSQIGHATVKDGSYLVTHNHFGRHLSLRDRDAEPIGYVVVRLFDSSGEMRFEGSLSDFELMREDPETLVIAPKEDGLLQKLGFASAEFEDWLSVPLEAGMEVAQVDWDGAKTRVDWTLVQEVNVEDGVPRLVLDDSVAPGASGGGIFWRGVHIANNWAMVQQFEGSGALIDIITKAALNSIYVAGEPVQSVSSY
jgi:hypothetical protein